MINLKRSLKTLFIMAMGAVIMTCSALAATDPNAEKIVVPNLPVWDGTVAESYAGGNGTQNDPYLISDGSQLAYLMKQINDTQLESEQTTEGIYYKLTNDILLNDISDYKEWSDYSAPKNVWTPGGAVVNYTPKGFSGYFDGNNYDIIGMFVNGGNSAYNGLFGYIYNGQIKNLGIKYSLVSGGNNTSALAGYIRASSSTVYVSGCRVENTQVYGKNNVGIFGGYIEAYQKSIIFDKCSTVDCLIEGSNYVGGIGGLAVAYGVSYNASKDTGYAIEFTNCEYTGDSYIQGRLGVGGIIGSSKDFVSPVSGNNKIALLFKNCICLGHIACPSEHTGIIAGTVGPADREDKSVITNIVNCYAGDNYGHGIYGFTLSETNAIESFLYTGEEMKNESKFKSFDFDKIWRIVRESHPMLMVYGDALGDGKLTAADFIDSLSSFTDVEITEFILANIDFNADGEYDLSDVNSFINYLRNKGAK